LITIFHSKESATPHILPNNKQKSKNGTPFRKLNKKHSERQSEHHSELGLELQSEHHSELGLERQSEHHSELGLEP